MKSERCYDETIDSLIEDGKGYLMLGNNHIIISTRSTINISLCIYYCGSEETKPGAVWGPKVLDHFVLYYVYEGSGTITVKDKTFDVKKGQGFLIPKNALTSYKSDENNPLKLVWVGFYGFLAELYLLRAGLSETTPIFDYHADDFFLDHFKEMIEVSKRGYNRYCRMMSILYSMMSKLLDIASEQQEGEFKESVELYLRRALEFIEMNYQSKLTIENLSKHVGLDRKYLYSIFKKHVGESPQEYLINYRMTMARNLLENSTLSISNIAHSVGYSNPFHFSKIFKNLSGVSPSAYRDDFKLSHESDESYDGIENNEELKRIIKEKEDQIKQLNNKIDELKSVIINS
ncbi:AraC family transcriptional regulator [Acidaminobacter sp. JC074]|uniref:AraC family transcriptional regulator n=1 Tax=Acidaminobacter sp. JC074 TaxID=2530199 RepID=UPI001F0F486E|nr:AraC family transcriptional regulator [Acidaminobacter sp. JC074]MCH4888596.1 AraC family transcriptional regulator [Acidaminobacter sp. JC074]